jgi:hypothetical protein
VHCSWRTTGTSTWCKVKPNPRLFRCLRATSLLCLPRAAPVSLARTGCGRVGLDAVVQDQDQVFRRCGAASCSTSTDNVAGVGHGTLTCGSCLEDDVPMAVCTTMSCGHTFCNDCWKTHFMVQARAIPPSTPSALVTERGELVRLETEILSTLADREWQEPPPAMHVLQMWNVVQRREGRIAPSFCLLRAPLGAASLGCD